MAIYGSNGSSWQELVGTDLKASNGSSWQQVKAAYRSTGSTWDQVYSGSDEVTYYFVGSRSRAGRRYTWKNSGNQGGSNYPQISRYETNYPWFGLVEFLGGDATTGVSLKNLMEVRGVVKSAHFNIQRWSDGGFGNGYGNLYIGSYSGSLGDVNPDYRKCNFSGAVSKSWTSGAPLPRSTFIGGTSANYGGFANGGIALTQSLVDHLKTKPICLSHTNSTATLGSSGAASYADQANYWNFWPAGAQYYINIGPTLVVTLDYV